MITPNRTDSTGNHPMPRTRKGRGGLSLVFARHVRGGFARRAFSLMEVLISLSITGTLLAATLGALDASFKSYKATTESASTHVVSRIVIHRVMAMIRTGTEFGPFPEDVLDRSACNNPLCATSIEFKTFDDGAGNFQIVRIQRRDAATQESGPYELWYIEENYANNNLSGTEEHVLLSGLTEASFLLEYDVGPRLVRATVDLTIKPNDLQDARIGGDLQTPTIRLVSSVSPRKLD